MRSETDSTENDKDGLLARFAVAIASLNEGELMFPPPFDLSSSAALASNLDTGEIARKLFDVTASRSVAYKVQITAYCPQHPEMPSREVIGTEAPSLQTLVALLESFVDELTAEYHDHTP